MTGATMSMTMGARWQPSRTAQATRSLRLAERLRTEGRQHEYRAAIAEHFAAFAPAPASCPLR
ncbi:hypothetical protein MHY30_14950 [Microbacterium sp. ACRRU]|uniref:hypothetical protein n=1 Tax=Microbacterium sp. ACRRU TaxID=2918204 RepID=UPI001EF411FA|nr:hypothetical protein [Microbacterium sp. ACRRU]MCG7418802.1 hypothetical protein [Microbacterium sp. ACRRU]